MEPVPQGRLYVERHRYRVDFDHFDHWELDDTFLDALASLKPILFTKVSESFFLDCR